MALQKSSYDVEQLRQLGQISARIVEKLGQIVAPGVNAADLEELARTLCYEAGVEPAFLGYQNYQYATCISVNDEVVHSLPTAKKIFKSGDVVSIDFGVKRNGYYSDHCRTFAVGELTALKKRLLTVGKQAVDNAINRVKAGARIGDLSAAMEQTATEAGFTIVTEYVGHGIGKKLHEAPEIPAFGLAGSGPMLKENMVICVECQVCEKAAELVHDPDGWTTRTKDGGTAVMFEQMVLVLPQGFEILTDLN